MKISKLARRLSTVLAAGALLALPGVAHAAPFLDGIAKTENWPPQLVILAGLTLMSLLPAIVITMTAFTRFIIVLSFLRQGLGTSQAPPNQVIVGLSLFLTAFTMAPVAKKMMHEGYDPYMRGEISQMEALERGTAPLKSFMLRQTREADLELFYEASDAPLPKTESEVPLYIAAPAFLVSELTTAFEMAILILLPFLVIDIAVASGLVSLGMMMMPPATIALPIKLIIFVVVDGFNLLIGSLLRSFQ
jgi:flagellar biosynthesis protein FliP